MPAAGPEPRVQLLTRPGCHLCDTARSTVQAVVGSAYLERDVDMDPALAQRYGDEVPVVLVDGRQIGYWRIPEDRLRRALDSR